MSHPHFRVEIDVTHHLHRFDVPEGYDPKPEPGDTVHKLDSGHRIERLVPWNQPYFVNFPAGSIDTVIAERAAAKALEPIHAANGTPFTPIRDKSFGHLVAEHLIDGAMLRHSPVSHWAAVRVEAPPGFDDVLKTEYGMKRSLQDFLRFYFDLE